MANSIDIWKERLLDLSKKNNLLNFRDSKSSTLELLLPSIEESLERFINDSKVAVIDPDYTFVTVDTESNDVVKYDKNLFVEENEKKLLKRNVLLYNKHTEVRSVLKNLKKKANESMVERGVNILFIAFGFLKYKDDIHSPTTYKAPLLLLPISLDCDSINSPYYISALDDVLTLNSTLKYMLERDYGIQLPEQGDQDLDTYFNCVENITSGIECEVVKEARISLFSFSKLSMYIDLSENEDKIINNPNVSVLLGHESYEMDFSSDSADVQNDLFLQQHNVVDADFSQSEAIAAAISGKSFVLQGPPGTGKSQTITNIIAELLYAGKKVLFVSEKMAALEVVAKNLNEVELSQFCLQLHSSKTNKKEFIEDLYQRLESKRISEPNDENKAMLEGVIEKLNYYDKELFKPLEGMDMSLFQLLGEANHYQEADEVENYFINNIYKIDKDTFLSNCNDLGHYINLSKYIGYDYRQNPFYGIKGNSLSFESKQKFRNIISNIQETANTLLNIYLNIQNIHNIPLRTKDDGRLFEKIIRFCYDNKINDDRLLIDNTLGKIIAKIPELKDLSTKIKYYKGKTISSFKEEILKVDCISFLQEFKEYEKDFFKRIYDKEYKQLKKRFNSYLKIEMPVFYRYIVNSLKDINKYKESLELFNKETYVFNDLTIAQYLGVDTDWDNLLHILTEFNELLLTSKVTSGSYIYDIKVGNIDINLINKLSTAMSQLKDLEERLTDYFDTSILQFDKYSILEERDKVKYWITNIDLLESWSEFTRLFDRMQANQLVKFLNEFLDDYYDIDGLVDSYKQCFYRQYCGGIFESNDQLSDYLRSIHDQYVSDFNKYDNNQLVISRRQIRSKLINSFANMGEGISGSPSRIIRSEHEKKKKIKSILLLLKEIHGFIQELKPCFLMSPLSVSTYLPADITFDTVIFDEASQVFPEDAIGAIYRSKQLIVVGDSKQMPPTKFFMSANDDDEYNEDESDLDAFQSILDLCTAAFPKKSLLCHYRSREEGLILFSNINFYKGNLVTYPSVCDKHKDFGVEFIYVQNGVMDSRLKVNIKEAELVVELAIEQLKKYPDRSLGVIAFNIKQQEAILKLIDKRIEKDPKLEELINRNTKEKFFVKNLETVQGDERDTIIFSISYAKNADGQFALRFGPLNNEGGERRLNVAITRAKWNVKVVSSIRATDIDVSRVSNIGPKLLHDYLDYAEKGIVALENTISVNNNLEFDSPFEKDVYEFLKENGYDVTPQVGSSKYRIDIGLKKPGTSDYVLAIECDGATYHSSRSARDRDRLRQSILEKMNWNFYRIWSTDWFRKNSIEKKALLEACDLALSGNYESSKVDDIEPNIEEESIIEIPTLIEDDQFDQYIRFDRDLGENLTSAVEQIVRTEGPIAIEYLMKIICKHFWNQQKVTSKIEQQFYRNCNIRLFNVENGFLYIGHQKNYAMRRNIGYIVQDIDNVSAYEIRNGMYDTIKKNYQCSKDGLFSYIRKEIGFARTGDKINQKLEDAFVLLKPYVLIDNDGIISINPNNQLEIHRRKDINL